MPLQLSRHASSPLLLPDPMSDWECFSVFNPSVIYHKGLFHMHYRAQGLDWVSRIGYAVSTDGIHWNRLRRPILEPIGSFESRGIEDPRITKLDGAFYMTYTAYGREYHGASSPAHQGGGILPMVARSENLITWERVGPIVWGEADSDHVLFPRRIGGRYVLLHRRRHCVWIAYSEDLLTWNEDDMSVLYTPRENNQWDCVSVGNCGVPIETKEGWLLINYACDRHNVYRLGVVLLDLENPAQVISRPHEPIFQPEELWELRGDVPNMVFSNANPVIGNSVYVYYGAGNRVIGLATCRLSELLHFARYG